MMLRNRGTLSTVVGDVLSHTRENLAVSFFLGSLSTVVGRCQLTSREDHLGLLFFDVDGNQKPLFEVFIFRNPKALRLMTLMMLFVAFSLAFE